MSVELVGIVGALAGMLVSYAILRTHISNVRADNCQDAYEKGWSEGYDVGYNQSKPTKTRAKRIRKADA